MSRAAVVVFVVLAAALVLGAGPGIELVNRPESIDILGVPVPWLYAWGLLWYGVEAVCVVFACAVLWRTDDDDAPRAHDDSRASGEAEA